jgi:hypothetical protein
MLLLCSSLTAASGNESNYGDSDVDSIDGDMPHTINNTTSTTANTSNNTNTTRFSFGTNQSQAPPRPRYGGGSSSNNNNNNSK